MFDYFKPLRRKLGVVTLMVACAFAAGWVRSLGFSDRLEVRTGDHASLELISNPNELIFSNHRYANHSTPSWMKWKSFRLENEMDVLSLGYEPTYMYISWNWCGFRFSSTESQTYLVTPYGMIVIPLTLLSACLLSSGLRSKRQS